LNRIESNQVTFLWFLIDGFTHLSIELGYVLVALGPTARRSDSYMGEEDEK